MPKNNRNHSLKDLSQLGTLNPNSQSVIDEQFAREGGFFDAQDVVQVKYEMLRRVANGQPIDEAIHAFGFSSRQVFYRARAAFEQAGLAGLVPAKRGPKRGPGQTRSAEHPLHQPDVALPSAFVSDDLKIDFVMRRVRTGNKNVRLTPKEFDLLRYLVSHSGRPVPHQELLCAVWGPESGDQIEHLRVFITYLRKKIEPNPANPRYIVTEPWVGYGFMTSPE